MEETGLEGPSGKEIVAEEPSAIEVGIIGQLRDNRSAGDQRAGFEHATDHGYDAASPAVPGHAQRGSGATAFDELDIESIKVSGRPADVPFEHTAFVSENGETAAIARQPVILGW